MSPESRQPIGGLVPDESSHVRSNSNRGIHERGTLQWRIDTKTFGERLRLAYCRIEI